MRIVRLTTDAGYRGELPLGYSLVNTATRSGSGLMRAVWSCEALQRNIQRDWLFAPGDARAMRQAVRLRAVPQLARLGIGD